MCGLCAEGRAVELAKVLSSGSTWPSELEEFHLFDTFYMQETDDIIPALTRMEYRLREIMKRVENQEKNASNLDEFVCLQVVLCRVMETLIKNGFHSYLYQKLITSPLILDVIKFQSQRSSCVNERLIPSASLLRRIFQSESLFTDESCDIIFKNPEMKSDCLSLLRAYVNWWHYGEGMGHKAMGGNASEEYDLFLLTFPYVFLSYTVVETSYPDHELIDLLIRKRPYFGATPENFDVWLQRKAALRVFDTTGIGAFLPYSNEPRPPFLYYFVIKNKLRNEEKNMLRQSILESGQYVPEKDWSFAKKRMLIYEDTESWILDAL